MASSLSDRYNSLSLADCFKDPFSRTEELLSIDPLVDISLSASTFVVPPGKEVNEIINCGVNINNRLYFCSLQNSLHLLSQKKVTIK